MEIIGVMLMGRGLCLLAPVHIQVCVFFFHLCWAFEFGIFKGLILKPFLLAQCGVVTVDEERADWLIFQIIVLCVLFVFCFFTYFIHPGSLFSTILSSVSILNVKHFCCLKENIFKCLIS